MPDAAFYLWARTPIDDALFAKRLLAEQAVKVLPGSFLAREAHGTNPGRGYIRIALVAARDECAEAVDRIVTFAPVALTRTRAAGAPCRRRHPSVAKAARRRPPGTRIRGHGPYRDPSLPFRRPSRARARLPLFVDHASASSCW